MTRLGAVILFALVTYASARAGKDTGKRGWLDSRVSEALHNIADKVLRNVVHITDNIICSPDVDYKCSKLPDTCEDCMEPCSNLFMMSFRAIVPQQYRLITNFPCDRIKDCFAKCSGNKESGKPVEIMPLFVSPSASPEYSPDASVSPDVQPETEDVQNVE